MNEISRKGTATTRATRPRSDPTPLVTSAPREEGETGDGIAPNVLARTGDQPIRAVTYTYPVSVAPVRESHPSSSVTTSTSATGGAPDFAITAAPISRISRATPDPTARRYRAGR